ncbi:MAG: hypothetical protein MSA09_07625 [Lachnospiraceae bacterium]|nr:hypothetical protein [Lachnospiraceae bacterium]
MYLKLYLSEQEKRHLESIAENRGISLSRLCYEQIVPLLSDPLELPPEGRTGSKNSLKLDRCVKVYFTDSEYQELLTASKGLPLSRFIRKEYLSRKEPVVISVYTDDISALAVKVSAYIEQLNNFIAALAIRRQLYEADYQKLIQIANDTQIALKEVATYTKNNRKSIRASGVRILRKEIHRAVQQYFSDTVASSGRPQKGSERS